MGAGFFEDGTERLPLFVETRSGEVDTTLGGPGFAVLAGDRADRSFPEASGELAHAEMEAGEGTWFEMVSVSFDPGGGEGLEAGSGDVTVLSQTSDLEAEVGDAAVGEFAILGLERTTKLLAALFHEPVIRPG